MEEISEKVRAQVPVPEVVISDDGHVTIHGVYNDEQLIDLFPYGVNYTIEENGSENIISCSEVNEDVLENEEQSEPQFEKETLVNIDVNSEVLEEYMEVFITYKCKECSYTSNDQKEFHQHCLEHLLKENTTKNCFDNTTYVYLCSSCNKAFNSSEETKQHMIEKHELKNDVITCDKTPEKVFSKMINVSIETADDKKEKKELRKKRKQSEIIQSIDPTSNANNLMYSCLKQNCNVKFSNEKHLNIHEKCHISMDLEFLKHTKLFQCFKCNELFHDWHSCSSHLFKMHDIDCDLLKCPICENYRTSIPLRLENHIRIHSDVRAFTCKHCGKTFKQASQLRNHMVTHADKESPNKPKWSRSIQCNICFKMYSDSKSLKKHKEEVHSRLRPFVCNICGHASARKSMLLMHQRQHTGLKPYECTLCDFKTADHNSLRKHIMRHTGVRPYKCPHCEYAAIQSGSFKNHLKLVHPDQKGMFVCGICLYKTVSEDNHVRHISDHLTGLIKDKEGAKSSDTNKHQNSSGILHNELATKSMFCNGRGIEETNEHNETEYSNHSNNHIDEDSLIDTGGITIPAEPHTLATNNCKS